MQAARGASLNPSDHDDRPARRPLGIFFGVALVAYLIWLPQEPARMPVEVPGLREWEVDVLRRALHRATN